MPLEKELIKSIEDAFLAIYQQSIQNISLQETKKEFEGTHTLVVFPYTKLLSEKPSDIAQKIGDYLVEKTALVEKYNVVQGFLNLSLANTAWLQIFEEIWKKPRFQKEATNEKVVVEYSSPNTNKPLHLGHLRNNFLGFSLANILKANGYEVHKTQIVNDRGIHICKSMLAYQKFGNNETPESSGIKGDHLVGKYYVEFDKLYKSQIAELKNAGLSPEEAEKEAPAIQEAQKMLLDWENGKEEVVQLWKKMNSWVFEGFDETYKKIGVHFDSIYYESNTYLLGKDIVEEGLAKKVFYRKEDNSVWIDLTAEGLDNKLILRSDGTSVYITQDIGTAELRYKDQMMQKMVYVVGNEQDYHFKVLFLILKKLGRNYAEGLHHLSYGMVELPTGKMKSREGTVVDADDLVAEVIAMAKQKTEEKMLSAGTYETFTEEEKDTLFEIIGLGSLKYFLLKIDAQKKMLFNPEESVSFEGDAAPFIQYTHARIKSVLRKAAQEQEKNWQGYFRNLQQVEVMLIRALHQYLEVITAAAERYAPYLLAQYLYDLSKLYSSFYAECSILKAESSEAANFRLALSELTAQTLKEGMFLLGIDVPERM
ncbi:MAG: arginine--tRNA ligase [Thermonemataceae bacterium]|nr:arginine--tRNA ligase [Thermonemataceae bacterium]